MPLPHSASSTAWSRSGISTSARRWIETGRSASSTSLALAGEVIGALAADLDRREGRRPLHDLAGEPGQRRLDRLARRPHVRGGDHLAVGVVGVGVDAPADGEAVELGARPGRRARSWSPRRARSAARRRRAGRGCRRGRPSARRTAASPRRRTPSRSGPPPCRGRASRRRRGPSICVWTSGSAGLVAHFGMAATRERGLGRATEFRNTTLRGSRISDRGSAGSPPQSG